MEVGETVAVVMAMQGQDKCAICDGSHKDPKKEKIEEVAPGQPSGWKRDESMSSKFEKSGAKLAIYPSSQFKPPYNTEGHHCLAFSGFVQDAKTAPKDRILRLNHYLNQIGYKPNRDENCIHLPGRRNEDAPKPGEAHSYQAFWKAIDLDRPLQMHIGNHDESFFTQSLRAIAHVVTLFAWPALCEETDDSEMKKTLGDLIGQAENYAFTKIAVNDDPWRLHPDHEKAALRLYDAPTSTTETYLADKKKVVRGHAGTKDLSSGAKWPKVDLDTGPF
jgi:hypothetical protein